MAKITDIKRRIQELAPAPFQEFCDTFLSKKDFGKVHGYGMKAGTGKTTTGNPDTYFRKENGKYIFVVYTTQQSDIYSKLREDIVKCFNTSKTGLDIAEIEEIICCHTSSNLSAGDDKKLHELCESQGIALTIYGIDEIANQVHNRYRSLAKDYLGLSIDTNQILHIDDFIAQYDANVMSAPLSTIFQYRDKEKAEIIRALGADSVVVVTGKAGVGKTRIVLESVKTVATTNGYKLLCVKNNNLGIYEDLVSATEQLGKYLFFIDDANELAKLSQVLSYTTKEHLGYEVKIILTVRDYAKANVISEIKEYARPHEIEISSFSDDEIIGFLRENLKIVNHDYVKQIVRIAEGNPRIAYMAGKLAVEKQNLSVIRDVSELYDAYYEKYVNSALGEDIDLCFTAGILSVVNAVLLSNMSALNETLTNYGITSDDFKSKILQLAKMEVVEIQFDQVATLSDQCLANYMLYYVFIQRKIIPLGEILETGYKHFRNGVLKALSTIFNLFESKETRAYCKQEILKVWDNLQKNQDVSFEQFVKDFHVFRPEEAFLIAQQKINNIKNEEIDINNIDFTKNSYCHEETVLELLTGYQNSEYMDYVMEILLDYCGKTREALVSGYKWLENRYGINTNSYKDKYYTQRKISAYLCAATSCGNIIALAVGYQWAKYSLSFNFHSTETGRGNTFNFYDLKIEHSEETLEYRQDCWKILILLAAREEWQDKVIMVLDDYARHLQSKPDIDIVTEDFKAIEQILLALDSNCIALLKVIHRLLVNADKLNVEYNKKWLDKLSGNEWELYNLFAEDFILSEFDEYKDFEAQRKSRIIDYGKKFPKSEINNLVKSINEIFSNTANNRDIYAINQGIEWMLQQFEDERLHEFLNTFIQFGTNISIRPWTVLEALNRSGDSFLLLLKLKEAEFPQKNDWLFCFFETLPEEKSNSEMLEEFLCFLKEESDKSICSPYNRSLRALDKFLSVEPNIYPISSSIIYEKRKYNSFIVETYFQSLFHDEVYSPKELLFLFQSDVDVLQEIYFYMLRVGNFIDYMGTFLQEFLLLGEMWLHKYAEIFWRNVINHEENNCQISNMLWKSENHITYYDYLFYNFPEEEMYSWKFRDAFKDILTHSGNDNMVKNRQKEWLTHIIVENARSERICIIFKIVCELDEDIRRHAIEIFLENNSDFEMFEKISIVPNDLNGGESFVPAYQEQIDFLESLYTCVSGVKHLKHRAKIKEKVEELQEMIKLEELKVIYRKLYM